MAWHFSKGSAARCRSDLRIRDPLIPGGLAVGVSKPVESVGASRMLGWAPSKKIEALPNRGVQPTLRRSAADVSRCEEK